MRAADPVREPLSAVCQAALPLARGDAQHFVSRCEHGTVFLTWQRFTWSFDPADFVHFSTFVSCAARADRNFCSGDFALCPIPAGLRLWVAEVGLALTLDDFERLRDLLENALWALRSAGAVSKGNVTAPPARKMGIN